MSAKACPACQESIGLGTYFNQLWLTRIACPSCRATLHVRGMGAYYASTLPVALVVGVAVMPSFEAHGVRALLAVVAATAAFGSVALAVGLSTWMRLEAER